MASLAYRNPQTYRDAFTYQGLTSTPSGGQYLSLQGVLNQLAGTTANPLATDGAANAWAGTTGLALLGALNRKNGSYGLGMNLVCNQLAGTSGLYATLALNQLAGNSGY